MNCKDADIMRLKLRLDAAEKRIADLEKQVAALTVERKSDVTPWVDDGFVNAPGGKELEGGPPYVEAWKQGKCIQCKAERPDWMTRHCEDCFVTLPREELLRNEEAAQEAK